MVYFPERPSLENIPNDQISLHEWISLHLVQLAEAFNVVKDNAQSNNNILLLEEFASRTPSETRACDAADVLASRIPLPDDFEIVHGSVTIEEVLEDSYPVPVGSHLFFKKVGAKSPEEDIIGCITTGQFVKPDRVVNRGERINLLQRTAANAGLPGLVHTYGDFALVCGTRQQLSNVFGLNFHDIPDLPYAFKTLLSKKK